MIPLRDNIPSRTTPVVNYTIIAVCALCFFVQMQEQPGQGSLVERLGMIPFRLTHPGEPFEMVTDVRRVMTPQGVQVVRDVRPAAPSAVPAAFTLLTCIFLHGGWMHFLGNMWFLYIFGDNVEDRFGHVGYLIFYLLAGVAASLSHLLSDPGSTIPDDRGQWGDCRCDGGVLRLVPACACAGADSDLLYPADCDSAGAAVSGGVVSAAVLPGDAVDGFDGVDGGCLVGPHWRLRHRCGGGLAAGEHGCPAAAQSDCPTRYGPDAGVPDPPAREPVVGASLASPSASWNEVNRSCVGKVIPV